jgi:hypothetical protein
MESVLNKQETSATMAFLLITLEQLPSTMIPFELVRTAFDKCVPYDCPSRSRFWTSFPERSWGPTYTDDIPMERVAKILCNCLPTSADIGRFALFFAGERIASHEVLLPYLTQTFVKA